MPITIESPEEWQERQGKKVFVRGQFIFESGAILSAESGMRWEPPADERQRLKIQLDYWNAMVTKASKQYSDHLNVVQDQVNLSKKYSNLPLPSANEFAQIRLLAKRIEHLKRKRDAVQDKIKPTAAQQQREHDQREHSAAIVNARKQLSSLPRI